MSRREDRAALQGALRVAVGSVLALACSSSDGSVVAADGGPGGAGAAGTSGGGVAGTGASGGTGALGGTGGSSAVGGTGGVPSCPNTPANAVESAPEALSDISDCANGGRDHEGVVAGTGDPDWLTFFGTDETLCVREPRLSVISSAGPVEACVFMDSTVTCTTGYAAQSPSGRNGCCANDDVIWDYGCAGCPDSDYVYIRVTALDEVCTSYTVNYEF